MHYDVIIVGGSYAGLSAAMQLARARRAVCVIDAGAPRNRFAEASHGFFGRDGAAPLAMIGEARDKVLAYPTVTFVSALATRAQGSDGQFTVTLNDGRAMDAKKLVLAEGVVDELPEIPGLRERWGKSVLHCPYCHGYEFASQRLGVLARAPFTVERAQLISEWGPTTLFLHGESAPDAQTTQRLAARDVQIEPARIVRLLGDGTALSGVQLADDRVVDLDALYIAPDSRLASPLAEQLGCVLEQGPVGPIIQTDATRRTTSVPGVYAAGDNSRAFANATFATADGVVAGVMAHHSLLFAAH